MAILGARSARFFHDFEAIVCQLKSPKIPDPAVSERRRPLLFFGLNRFTLFDAVKDYWRVVLLFVSGL